MQDQWIKDLKAAHQGLLNTLKKVPDEGKISGDWSKKELMAHIAGWYEEGVEGTPQILRGEKPASFRMSVNGYNKKSVEKRKDKTMAQIKKGVINLHKKWVRKLVMESPS